MYSGITRRNPEGRGEAGAARAAAAAACRERASEGGLRETRASRIPYPERMVPFRGAGNRDHRERLDPFRSRKTASVDGLLDEMETQKATL